MAAEKTRRTRRHRRGSKVQFGAPWSAGVKGATGFLVFMLVAMLVVLPLVVPRQVYWVAFLGPGIMLVTFGIVALFCVRGYTVQHRQLLIQRLFWETEITLEGLERAFADADAFRNSWRKAGNGGFLGYTGWFWNKRLGNFRAYLTDPARCVVLEFKDRKIVVSPDDPERFVEALGYDRSREGGAR